MLALVAWGSAAGCGGDTAPATAKPIALEDLPTHLAALTCGKLFECCTKAEIMVEGTGSIILDPFTDEAGCRASFLKFLSQSIPRLQTAVNEKRLVYDANAAGACIDMFTSLSCHELTTSDPPKCEYFTPLLHDGDVCDADAECTSNFCDIDPSSQTGQQVCVPLAKLGQPCTGACEDGAVCDFVTLVCSPAKKLGEPCSLSSDCDSQLCSNGVCVVDSICPPAPAAGAP
jgi:hypothetical protein